MNITIDKDSEFSITMKDFIETLSQQDEFLLKIWVNGSEIPYKYKNDCDFHFISEGIRITRYIKYEDLGEFKTIDYVLYDTIVAMRLEL